MARKQFSVASLFCGAGGMDLGFRQAGFRACAAFDLSEAAVSSYNRNDRKNVARCLDLSKVSPKTIARMVIESAEDTPRGLIGGPPCQGFSVGNATANPNDPRNQLPYRFVRILEEFDASFGIDFFVFENVPGLKSAKHLARFKRIRYRLDRAGFFVHEQEMNAADFSVPQNRRRLFLVGINKRIAGCDNFLFPRPNSSPSVVRNVIGSLPEPVFRENGMLPADIPYHPNHWTMRPLSKRFSQQAFNAGRSFRQLKWDQPSWTVAYGNREIHVHPDGHRRLSILEALLLQGFPERFVLEGTFSQQVEQVSNAVPPPVAKALARAISQKLRAD